MKIHNRIDSAFSNHLPLICFAPICDPMVPDNLIEIYHDCGVDIIEIGLPHKDPYADGPTIVNSMQRSQDDGFNMEDVVERSQQIAETYSAMAQVWMCYEDADLTGFAEYAKVAKVDGLLMVGFEKRPDREILSSQLKMADMHQISFVKHDVNFFDIEVARSASGYVMLQAFDGKTGARDDDVDANCRKKIQLMRAAGITLPIALGIGISNPKQVSQAISLGADGIVVGSACVNAAIEGEEVLRELLSGIKSAIQEHSSDMEVAVES